MFDKGYAFSLIDRKEISPKSDFICYWLYNFSTEKRRYIINVELYKMNIYIIKYYAACHAKSKNKYNLLVNDENPAPIIRTCIDVMIDFYKLNPLASFGFIGSHSVNKIKKGKKKIEDKSNTQRFRIYQMLMFNFFGKKTFAHSRSKKHSAYLMINRKNGSIKEFKKNSEKMFSVLYSALDF